MTAAAMTAPGRKTVPRRPKVLVFTQGDPAGIGPEILLKLLAVPQGTGVGWQPLIIAERAALEAGARSVPGDWRERLVVFSALPTRDELAALDERLLALVDPVGMDRQVVPGKSTEADAGGAVAALDTGIEAARSGLADALVTGPVSKASIARHHLPGFLGHTDYLAAACGLERYGRDYLMAFLAPELQVALLTAHLPLARALESIDRAAVLETLELLWRQTGGRVALAGLNPHAGEGGLLGAEEKEILEPAVVSARERGIDVHGPESPDSLFARARRGTFDWVLALYHDQGLIAVKTAAFGSTTNWTLGLPFLRTSVDHGTGFDLAGQGRADEGPLTRVVEATLKLISGELPRRARAGDSGVSSVASRAEPDRG